MPNPDAETFTESTTPTDAARVLSETYAERAGEEALFRAMLAERDLRRHDVQFWLDVYTHISAC